MKKAWGRVWVIVNKEGEYVNASTSRYTKDLNEAAFWMSKDDAKADCTECGEKPKRVDLMLVERK